MWPMPTIRNDIITAYLDHKQLHLAHVTTHKKNMVIAHVTHKPHSTYNHDHTHILNTHTLNHHLHEFIQQHQLAHARIAWAFAPPIINATYHTLATMTPQKADLQPLIPAHNFWRYSYLFQTTETLAYYYFCTIPPEIMTQTYIISLQNNLHSVLISSDFLSRLTLYKQYHTSSFRPAQLALDYQHHEQLENYFSRDKLYSFFGNHIDTSWSLQDIPYISLFLGLYYGVQTHEI